MIRTRATRALGIALIGLGLIPAAAGAASYNFSNTTPIGSGNTDEGPKIPYPSLISTADLPGKVTNTAVTLAGIRSTAYQDIDIALIGPAEKNVLLMSDLCGGNDFSPRDLTLDDTAPTQLPGDADFCKTGTYRPGNFDNSDDFPAPGPGTGPFGSALSVFNGGSPNGNWRLYLVKDGPISVAELTGGWRLKVTTDAPNSCGGKPGTIFGTNDSDTIKGTKAADVIVDFGGNDVIQGLGGNDVICGGDGRDTLIGGKGNDKLLGQGGNDKLKGGPGADRLKGGAGKDKQLQ